jgi:hypothetical protein
VTCLLFYDCHVNFVKFVIGLVIVMNAIFLYMSDL